jgi:hypothetical protein
MKLNRSLAISSQIQDCTKGNIVGILEQEFPSTIFEIPEKKSSRERIFTVKNTLLTMVLTAIQEDKTLANSVNLYHGIHQRNKDHMTKNLEIAALKQKEEDDKNQVKRAGRPKKYKIKIPKSLNQDISLNTAAYSKARDRVSIELTDKLFKASRLENVSNDYSHWHGYRVLIGDGTYVQMQDTPMIREDYEVRHKEKPSEGYPQGLLEVLIERGTGQVYDYILSNRHVSELALFYEMIDHIPPGTILLLDDLYNCYEIISKCKRKGIELIFPAKRERKYEVVKVIAPGDEIIRIKAPDRRSKWLKENEPANTFLMRRITSKSPKGVDYILHSTVIKEEIVKEEFNMLYLTRWDIEISIREIKTIMDINILRSKTPEMALKELKVSLAAYNLIRRIIYAATKELPFSPKEDFIQKFYTHNKKIHIDKTGRIYNRWSTGRRRTKATYNDTTSSKAKTQ